MIQSLEGDKVTNNSDDYNTKALGKREFEVVAKKHHTHEVIL